MSKKERTFYSLEEATKYAHICKQALCLAIKQGKLKAEKKTVNKRRAWVLTSKDIDDYRANKYRRDLYKIDGKLIFDLEEGRWSVLHASKTLSAALGRPYTAAHIYYLLRLGKLKAFRRGAAWVISRDQVIELYNQEIGKQTNNAQLHFA